MSDIIPFPRRRSIAVIGLGYVGLPLAEAISRAGHRVIGVDSSQPIAVLLSSGLSPIHHIPHEAVQAMVARGFTASTELTHADVYILCVPTPLTKQREPDVSAIVKATEAVAEVAQDGDMVILESTTYPGTTAELVGGILRARGRLCRLVYSPERIDPNNPEHPYESIPKLVSADDRETLELACELYRTFTKEVVPVEGTRTAEAAKLFENTFRAVNIALVNELKVVLDRMGIDIWEVIRATETKPFGFMRFDPGPGIGGHCIPCDPFYLSWKAREHDLIVRLIEAAGAVNWSMPYYVVDKTAQAVAERHGRTLQAARVLVVGLAYKPDVDDDRESPAYKVMELLRARRATVDHYDPLVSPEDSIDLDEVGSYHAVVIITAHSRHFPKDYVLEHAQLIVDTRGIYPLHPKVVRA